MKATRRQFLLGLAGAGALGGPGLLRWLARHPIAPDGPIAPSEGRVEGLVAAERTSRALGAEVSIRALHEDQDLARRAVDAAFDELELVESVMSIYRPESQVSVLNRTGSLERPHPHLVAVLSRAQEIAAWSGGKLDVTVQPLWELYASAKKAGRLPGEAELARARSLVDHRRLSVSAERVTLGAGMAITLNGIAQGYAADRVLAALRAHGVAHALVSTGEHGSLGCREDGGPWTLGIQHPRREDAYVALVHLDGRCVATSGDYATTFTEDRTLHHIFDPATGRSPLEVASATVVAPAGMDADALTKAVFGLGAEAGLALVERTSGADALVVTKDGRVLATRGFPRAS